MVFPINNLLRSNIFSSNNRNPRKVDTVWCDDSFNSSSSTYTFILNNFFYSFFYISIHLFFVTFRTSSYKNFKKLIEICLRVSFSCSDNKLPVFWTLNFESCFDYKLGHLFYNFVRCQS